MKAFWNTVKHKYFKVAATVMVLFLPIILVVNQQEKETRSRASASTTLSFSPTTTSTNPLVKKIGDSFSLDLIVEPGSNTISSIKLDIIYDPTKVSLSSTNPLAVNETVFSEIIEGPIYTSGRIQIILAAGPNLSSSITTASRALTLNLVAKNTTSQTLVSFGSNNFIYSVSSNNSGGENVLSTTIPAYLNIVKANGKNSGGGKDKPPR